MISGIPKMKLYNLVKLLVKDPAVDSLQLNAIEVRYRLDMARRKY